MFGRLVSCFLALGAALLIVLAQPNALSVHAQVPTEDAVLDDPEPIIERAPSRQSDTEIRDRLIAIYAEIDTLKEVSVDVQNGVIFLGGTVANEAEAARAQRLAIRIEGAVTVRDLIDRTLAVGDNIAPILQDVQDTADRYWRALPLFGVALVVFLTFASLAYFVGAWRFLWRRVTPNAFLAEIISQAARIIILFVGLFVSLNIVGATALTATILGGAGVAGLAIGFAVRDTLENYFSSVMLSLRQPFRAGDHVIVGDHEGVVVRLTTRATILMTLDGNHLRIPNADVFKATILNYTTNKKRRFSFTLGVDANDDPIAAMNAGRQAILDLQFVLQDPAPYALIDSVGDSSILIIFHAWIDQEQTDFAKSRSLAIRAVKDVLEAKGFTLPEPIYRLRFDDRPSPASQTGSAQEADKKAQDPPDQTLDGNEAFDVSPEVDVVRGVADEDASAVEENLLDDKKPSE